MTSPDTTLERDPVCGMNVDPATAKYTGEHSGKKYFFCCGQCADKFLMHPQAYAHKPAPGLVSLGLPASSMAQAAERDPVCGMSVNLATAKFVSHREGKKTYFCSRSCLEKFEADPARYLNKPAAVALPAAHKSSAPAAESGGPKTEAGSPVSYVCPMCPDVREPKPGACPSCGMALEPEMPLAVTRTEYTCPMHPQVVRSEPGSCPICGMALEPRTVTTAQEENPELRDMTRRFWVAVALTAPLLAIAMGSMFSYHLRVDLDINGFKINLPRIEL